MFINIEWNLSRIKINDLGMNLANITIVFSTLFTNYGLYIFSVFKNIVFLYRHKHYSILEKNIVMKKDFEKCSSMFETDTKSKTIKLLVTTLIISSLILLVPVTTSAQFKISEKEFDNKYASRFKMIDDNIVIQKVIEFPNMNKDELYNKAKRYMDDRILKKYTAESTNTDYSYTNYSLIITENKIDFLWSKSLVTMNASIRYIYKLEIKDSKLRATISARSFAIPTFPYLEFKDWFPYKDKMKKYMRRLLVQFVDYSDELFEHTKKGIETPPVKVEDEW